MASQNELHVVFGASGGAGSAVVRALVARGKQVRAVNRSGKGSFPAGVEMVRGDAADPVSARAAARGASVVYNCTNAPYTKWPTLFPPLWANVTDAAAYAGARLVVADNLYMYGPSDAPMTETTPYRAKTRKGETRIKMSEQLMDAHRSGKVQVAVGRAADYYGPGVTLSLYSDAMFRKALAGKNVQAAGNSNLPHTLSYIDDVGEGLATLGEHDRAFGEIWHLPVAPAITQRQFLTLLFEEAGQPPRISSLPSIVFKIAGLVVPIARELAELSYQYDAPFIVDSSKFERAFGVSATPYREGIRRTLAWVRAQPQTSAAPAH